MMGEKDPSLHASGLSLDERVNLCLSIGEECIQPEELRRLLDKKPNPVAYDGFEPSSKMHRPRGDEVLEREQIDKIGRDV